MFRRFIDAADYWFGYSDSSSGGSHDPARECFMVAVGDEVDGATSARAGDREPPPPRDPGVSAPQNQRPSAPPTSPTGGADINAQLAQARELEAKTVEEYRAVRLLRASIAGEAFARGERVRELGKQAHERINVDFNVDDPNTPSRASQKLVTDATMLQALPTLSSPEARNLHHEAQTLIEQAAVQQAESSASRMRQLGSVRDEGNTQCREASAHEDGEAGQPANLVERRPGSESLTRADKPRTVTPATSSMPAGRVTRRREQW
jgi:hypothetical protein